MKSFSDFAKKTKVAEANITKDKFYKNEVYKKGEWILTENGQVGKILRRGPNYVLCLTAEETTFRTWITNIQEVFEIGTDAYREYVMSLTPGQKVQKPEGTVKVKQTIPTDPIKDKMSHHESKSLAQIAAETGLNTSFKSMEETWRYDKSAIIGNTDIKGKGADGVGGGDAPGMKLAEPKGEEGKPSIKKVKHSCATKVEHPEWGEGNCLKEQHTLDEEGNVSHYDVMFNHGLEKDVSVKDIKITREGMHEHAINPTKSQREIEAQPPNEFVDDELSAEVKTESKKAKKDYDGDGKVESGKDEYFGSRDKAIKKAMGKKAMKKEHHEKDPATGKVIPHSDAEKDKDLGGDGTPSSVEEASLATARKNIGRDPKKPSCWKGYKAKGTKMKGGKSVPNCVKEFAEWRKEVTEKK